MPALNCHLATLTILICCGGSSNSFTFVSRLTTSIGIGIAFSTSVSITPSSGLHSFLVPVFVALVLILDNSVLIVVLGVAVAGIVGAVHTLALQTSIMLLNLQTASIIKFRSLSFNRKPIFIPLLTRVLFQ